MNLREQALRGGAYMVIRQGIGMGLALVAMLLLTRLIGPTAYGLYTTVYGVAFFFAQIARMGTDVYLVRREDGPNDAAYHQVFSFLLVSGTVLTIAGMLLAPAVGHWLNTSRVLWPLWAMFLLLPFSVLSVPSIARLERALDYRNVAILETVEILVNYATALVLAWYHWGVWAPIAGYGASRIWLIAGSIAMSRSVPRWHWSPALLGDILRFGSVASLSSWLWTIRLLIYIFVVGRFMGQQSVAYIALAIRMADGLNFVKNVTFRLSLAVMAKVQRDFARLRAAMEEAMALQVLASGPLVAGFALVAPWILPRIFGDQWMPALLVFPFIALGDLVNAIFNMQVSVLFVAKRGGHVTLCNAVHITVLAAAALWLVPRLGLIGWGLAEVIVLPTYLMLHQQVRRLFDFSYLRVLPWLIVFGAPLFTTVVGWPDAVILWLPLLLIPFNWTARRQVTEYLGQIIRRSHA